MRKDSDSERLMNVLRKQNTATATVIAATLQSATFFLSALFISPMLGIQIQSVQFSHPWLVSTHILGGVHGRFRERESGVRWLFRAAIYSQDELLLRGSVIDFLQDPGLNSTTPECHVKCILWIISNGNRCHLRSNLLDRAALINNDVIDLIQAKAI